MSQTITTEEIIKENLDKLIDQVGKRVFNADYKFTKEQVLGIIVSKYCEWSLEPFAEVVRSGLEDSNFHELEDKFSELIEKQVEEWNLDGGNEKN